MRLTKLLLAEVKLSEIPRHYRFIRYGERKWRDYQMRYYEPPYWYKWSDKSPYSPQEQDRISIGADLKWYKTNIHKLRVVQPDEWLYRIGDKVQVLEGKDKGKTGLIKKVVPEGNMILVGGRNTKYVDAGESRITTVEKPLQHHQVSLLDPIDKKPTDIEFRVNEDGEKVRISTRSGHIIYWPPEYLPDGTKKDQYVCGSKDTNYDDACTVTYTPSLDDWEEELAKHYKVDDPPRRKTYWY